jgi:hypothetical protein
MTDTFLRQGVYERKTPVAESGKNHSIDRNLIMPEIIHVEGGKVRHSGSGYTDTLFNQFPADTGNDLLPIPGVK